MSYERSFRSGYECERDDEADGLDRLGEEREPFDGLALGMEDWEAGRDHDEVGGDQAGEHGGRRKQDGRRRVPRERDREHGEHDRRDGKPEPGARALLEVLADERAVDAGADRAREDDDVDLQLGEPHPTITVPDMSWLCSVQT